MNSRAKSPPYRLFYGIVCMLHSARILTCLAVFWSWGWVAASADAADWLGFRGPSGDGQVTEVGLPLKWTNQENVRWKQAIPGEGWSSPVIRQGRIYLTASVPEATPEGTRSLRLLILRAQDGQIERNVEVFTQDATAPRIHSKNSHASPTPLIDGEDLFVHFGHQGTACLDLDGNLRWANRKIQYAPVHGNGGSPVLAGDALIFSCDGSTEPFIIALNRRTGEELWRKVRTVEATRKFSFSTPTLIEVNGQQQVISPGSDVVMALNPATGEEIWRFRYDGYSVIPKPVYAHGLLYVCTGYNQPNLLAIRPDGTGDVTETHLAWSTKKGVPHTPSLLLVGEQLYMVSDNGVASCLNALNGESYWSERLTGAFSASPIHGDGKIYFPDETGTTTVIRPGTTFEKLAENAIGERTLASFAVSDKALYLRSASHLYRIEAQR